MATSDGSLRAEIKTLEQARSRDRAEIQSLEQSNSQLPAMLRAEESAARGMARRWRTFETQELGDAAEMRPLREELAELQSLHRAENAALRSLRRSEAAGRQQADAMERTIEERSHDLGELRHDIQEAESELDSLLYDDSSHGARIVGLEHTLLRTQREKKKMESAEAEALFEVRHYDYVLGGKDGKFAVATRAAATAQREHFENVLSAKDKNIESMQVALRDEAVAYGNALQEISLDGKRSARDKSEIELLSEEHNEANALLEPTKQRVVLLEHRNRLEMSKSEFWRTALLDCEAEARRHSIAATKHAKELNYEAMELSSERHVFEENINCVGTLRFEHEEVSIEASDEAAEVVKMRAAFKRVYTELGSAEQLLLVKEQACEVFSTEANTYQERWAEERDAFLKSDARARTWRKHESSLQEELQLSRRFATAQRSKADEERTAASDLGDRLRNEEEAARAYQRNGLRELMAERQLILSEVDGGNYQIGRLRALLAEEEAMNASHFQIREASRVAEATEMSALRSALMLEHSHVGRMQGEVSRLRASEMRACKFAEEASEAAEIRSALVQEEARIGQLKHSLEQGGATPVSSPPLSPISISRKALATESTRPALTTFGTASARAVGGSAFATSSVENDDWLENRVRSWRDAFEAESAEVSTLRRELELPAALRRHVPNSDRPFAGLRDALRNEEAEIERLEKDKLVGYMEAASEAQRAKGLLDLLICEEAKVADMHDRQRERAFAWPAPGEAGESSRSVAFAPIPDADDSVVRHLRGELESEISAANSLQGILEGMNAAVAQHSVEAATLSARVAGLETSLSTAKREQGVEESRAKHLQELLAEENGTRADSQKLEELESNVLKLEQRIREDALQSSFELSTAARKEQEAMLDFESKSRATVLQAQLAEQNMNAELLHVQAAMDRAEASLREKRERGETAPNPRAMRIESMEEMTVMQLRKDLDSITGLCQEESAKYAVDLTSKGQEIRSLHLEVERLRRTTTEEAIQSSQLTLQESSLALEIEDARRRLVGADRLKVARDDAEARSARVEEELRDERAEIERLRSSLTQERVGVPRKMEEELFRAQSEAINAEDRIAALQLSETKIHGALRLELQKQRSELDNRVYYLGDEVSQEEDAARSAREEVRGAERTLERLRPKVTAADRWEHEADVFEAEYYGELRICDELRQEFLKAETACTNARQAESTVLQSALKEMKSESQAVAMEQRRAEDAARATQRYKTQLESARSEVDDLVAALGQRRGVTEADAPLDIIMQNARRGLTVGAGQDRPETPRGALPPASASPSLACSSAPASGLGASPIQGDAPMSRAALLRVRAEELKGEMRRWQDSRPQGYG